VGCQEDALIHDGQDAHISLGGGVASTLQHMMEVFEETTFSSSSKSSTTTKTAFIQGHKNWGGGPSPYSVRWFIIACFIAATSSFSLKKCNMNCRYQFADGAGSSAGGTASLELSLPLLNTLSSQTKGVSIGPYLTRSPIWYSHSATLHLPIAPLMFLLIGRMPRCGLA
jgi:hypothetical protein